MPTYEYRCDKGHRFEVIQRMTDDPVAVCEVCSRPVERVFHPIAVHFKGSGFYATDYGSRRRQNELKAQADSGAEKSEAKTAEKKGAAEKKDAGSKSNAAKTAD